MNFWFPETAKVSTNSWAMHMTVTFPVYNIQTRIAMLEMAVVAFSYVTQMFLRAAMTVYASLVLPF